MARKQLKYGDGAIYPVTKDGQPDGYMVQVFVKDAFNPNGKRVRRRAKTKEDAYQKLEDLKAAPASKKPEASTKIADWLDSYVEATVPVSGVSPRTVAMTKVLIANPLKPTLGSVTFKDFDATTAERWLARLAVSKSRHKDADGAFKPLASASRHKAFYILAKALDVAVRDGLLADNPLRKLKPPRVERTQVPATSASDFDKVIVPAVTGMRLEPLVVFIGLTGCRLGEALGVRWADVDLAAATVTIRRSSADTDRTKTGKIRTIPLVPDVVAALRLRRKVQREDKLLIGSGWQDSQGLVFTTFEGRPMNAHNARKDLQGVLRREGLSTERPFHSLRHGLATRLLEREVPMYVVSAILGHSSIKLTVDVYGHVEPVVHAEALAKALSQ